MYLYILRHGQAAPLGENGVKEDADRPLTDAGRQQILNLGGQLEQMNLRPEVVLTSPLLRARQTAELLVQSWSAPLPDVKVCDALAMEADRRRVVKALRKEEADSVLIVGHQPDLADLTAWLIGSKKAQLDYATGTLACLESGKDFDKGSAVLRWLVPPVWVAATAARAPEGPPTIALPEGRR